MSDSPAEQVITDQYVMKYGDPNDKAAFNPLSSVAINPLVVQALDINIEWLPIGTPYVLPKCGSSRCGFVRKKNKMKFTFYLDKNDEFSSAKKLYHYVAYENMEEDPDTDEESDTDVKPDIGQFDINLKTNEITNVYTCSANIVSALKMYVKFMSEISAKFVKRQFASIYIRSS